MMTRRALGLAVVTATLLAVPGVPRPATAIVAAAMPSDFNGDGRADLAIGAPRTAGARGGVSVLYGGPKGLTAAGDDAWSQDSPGIRDTAERNDRFGAAVASGDFDRDGYADLAVGVPGERTGGVAGGGVAVLYGSPSGLVAAGNQLWTNATLPGSTDLRGLGASLAAGDVDGDGYWDLVAGAPATANLDGVAIVLSGGPTGLAADGLVRLDRSMTGAEPLEIPEFGVTAAAGDLDGDGYADIALGVAGGEDSGGEVAVFHGSATGPVTAGSALWSQATPGIEDGGDDSFGFGRSLAIADFDADGYDDLAAGAPAEWIDGCGWPCEGYGAGAVNVIYGSASGLTTDGDQLWQQSSPGVPGSDEKWDRFGLAVAAGDFDADGFADLAVGVPGEDATRDFAFGRGAVVVLYGTADGLAATGAQRWTQDSPGIPNAREDGDMFGSSLVAGAFGKSAADDLAIGVPRESHHGKPRAGLVNVLYGRTDGLRTTGAQAWTKASDGVKGAAAEGEEFGEVLGR